MRSASSRISHCARLQQRSSKKCSSSRTFMVTTILRLHRVGEQVARVLGAHARVDQIAVRAESGRVGRPQKRSRSARDPPSTAGGTTNAGSSA